MLTRSDCRINQYSLYKKASFKVGCLDCSLCSKSLRPCLLHEKLQNELSANKTDRYSIFVFFSADTWLSQPADRFQSSLGYKFQQNSPLDFIYHRPWIITGLSFSLAVITYFRCSHTLQNQICPSDDLLWSFISAGLRAQPCAHIACPPPNRGVKSFQARV